MKMLFTKLKLNYFGQFHNREIELKPGINLIYGENEAGKSTLHTFIKGMLFGIERMRGRGAASKEDIYTRYLPWDYPGAYSGQMDIKLDDKEYRLQRSFHASDKSFKILDLETGREVKLKEGVISELLPGLTESTFKNTISIEQLKAQTESELASQVRNYITNLSIAKSNEVNVAKAVSFLIEQRKVLDATQKVTLLENLQSEIDEGLEKEERMDELTLKLQVLLTEEEELKANREVLAAAMDNDVVEQIEQLPAILEKYRAFKELSKQNTSIKIQMEELSNKIFYQEKEYSNEGALKEDLKEAISLSTALPEYERKRMELKKESVEALRSGIRKNMMISLFPSFVLALVTFILINDRPAQLVISSGFLLIGGILNLILQKISKSENRRYDNRIEELTSQLSKADNRLQEILERNQVTSILELNLRQEGFTKSSYVLEHGRKQLEELNNRKTELEDRSDQLQDVIMQYMQRFISEEELTEGSIQRLQEIIRQRKLETTQIQSESNRQYSECKLQIEKLRWEISTMEGNELQLLKNKDKYAQLEQRRMEDAVELEAVKLALDTIQGLSVDIHDSFGKQLNLAVSEIIGEVTGQRYTDLKIDEKLEVKVGWKGDYVLLDRLSAGTMDQVYFALRLAVSDLLLGKNEMPLILDDSFALYDENRVKAAILKVANRNQILLFSCHKRERRLLEEMGLPYHYVDITGQE